jgi:hypothetical protein
LPGSGAKISKKLFQLSEDLVESAAMLQAQNTRRRRVIELSDDEDEEEGGNAEKGSNGNTAGEEAAAAAAAAAAEDSERQQREDEDRAAAEEAAAEAAAEAAEQEALYRVQAWWKQKFPREFTQDAEDIFYLSRHCRSRTRLYHTLLHYKFRLLLIIRDRIQQAANRIAGVANGGADAGYSPTASAASMLSQRSKTAGKGTMFDTSWQEWEPSDQRALLASACASVIEDTGFMQREASRLQSLLKQAERRYGGKEQAHPVIYTLFL